MIYEFDKKFPDLMPKDAGSEKRILPSIDGEEAHYPRQEYSNRFLFLVLQKDAGFMAICALNIDTKKRLQTIKENLAKKPELLSNIETALKQYLPISYADFNKFDFFKQYQMVKDIRNNMSDDERADFDKLFEVLTQTKSKELKLDETESK